MVVDFFITKSQPHRCYLVLSVVLIIIIYRCYLDLSVVLIIIILLYG